jgi:hypothetical protein
MAADALAELVESLRADGSVDSHGQFTLDREQARSKMQKFQLADSRRYVLELVQAAVLRGAESIEFEIDTDDMRVRFGGQPFTEAELDDLYGSLFRPGDDRALRGVRQLALALNAALGMEPKHIELRSGTVELRMQPGKRDELIKHDTAQAHTSIHVRQRVRARMVLDFFANLTGRLAEQQYLRERCVYSTVPVLLDGKMISKGLATAEGDHDAIPLSDDEFVGFLRVTEGDEPTVLHLVKDGVWIDSRPLPECGTGLMAVVEGEQLRKDVSQARIVADKAVTTIVESIHRARWQLWRQVLAAAQGRARDRLAERVRVQLLQHVEFGELRTDEHALALAEQVTWKDCRADHPLVSLRRMVEIVVEGETPRFASRPFPEVPIEGAPILWMKKKDAVGLSKALRTTPVQANSLLTREEMRAEGHKAWLARAGEPVLPTHVQFQYRAELSGEDLGGEVGIDHHALFDNLQHPAQVLLYKQGRLLGRLELDIDIPNVWLVLEAGFNATDDYRDAVRDQVFVRALLAGFAALLEPLAELLADHVDDVARSANVRGLIKRYLIAMAHQPSQAALMSKANVDVGPKFHKPLAELFPGLTREGLLQATPPLLARQPLFAQVQGPHRSLAELAADVAAYGHVRYLPTPPTDPRFEAPGVVILGPGDRKLVRGIFGEDVCQELDTATQERRLRWLEQPQVSVAGLREQLERELSVAGVQASRWVVELSGSTRGFVIPAYANLGHRVEDLEPELLGRTNVRVFVEQRWLCELPVELGLGPLIAVVEADALRPDEGWESVQKDGAWAAVLADLRVAVEGLAISLCSVYEQEVPSVQRFLARMLLHAAARAASQGDRHLFTRMAQLPVLDTVSGRVLTLAQAQRIVDEYGKLEMVSRETSWAPLSDPEVVKAEPDERGDLVVLLGKDRVGDGEQRIRHRQLSEQLAARPRMSETKFDPQQVLVSVEITGDGGRRGVVGISGGRTQPSLQLRLGAAGYHLQDVFDHDGGYSVPVDAIVIDDQLPLGSNGMPVLASKRYQQLVRQVRGRIPSLVVELCQLWKRDDQRRPLVWSLLLGHLQHEAKVERRRDRQQAFEAASRIPGFTDVWGKKHSLHDILGASPRGEVRALIELRPRELPKPLAGELILQLDAGEHACLSANLDVVVLDDQWDAEIERLRWLADAPPMERPNVEEIAIAYRKATVGGGLECELWLPRDLSPLEDDAAPQVEFVREGRRLGRATLLELCPCAGLVSGTGLVTHGTEIVLDKRQRSSLLRQVLILYVDLCHALSKGRLPGKDHERALAYLAWVDHGFSLDTDANAEVFAVGKHGAELRSLVSKLVPPTLREALRRRTVVAEVAPAPAPTPAPTPAPAPIPEVAPTPPPEPPRIASTPSERLLGAIAEQLRWARARHGNLLDELRLTHLSLQPDHGQFIVQVQPAGLVFDSSHPLIRRLLAQDPPDRFDLAFAVAAVYTQMNHFAEKITDDDEREFVAQLAETLALSLQADPPRPT